MSNTTELTNGPPPGPKPCAAPVAPRHAGHIGDLTWITEIDQRRSLIALHVAHGQTRDAQLHSSLWLRPADAEAVAQALLAAVAAWRGAQ